MAHEPDPPSFVVLPESDEAELAVDFGADDYSGAPSGAAAGPLGLLARDRRLRWAAALLACLVAGAFMATAVTSEHAAVRDAAPAPPVPFGMPAPKLLAGGKPWPTSPAACGSVRYLPLVEADRLRGSTGVRVRVGGQTVHTIDLDARSSIPAPGLDLSSLQFVTQLLPGKDASYALVQQCESTDTSTVLRVSPTSSTVVLGSDRHIESLLPDGSGGVWAAEVADIATDGPVTMVQLPGPGVVRLPAGLSPIAVSGHRLIGRTASPDGRLSETSGTLVSYDLATRRLGGVIGQASSFTVDRGVLLWIDRPCSALTECVLHRYDVATGAHSARGYTLPVQTTIVDGVLSPDGTLLAFPMARLYEGPRIDDEGFGPPVNVAVLHLDNGVLERVAGLTLPPTERPGLTFAGNGDWLVIALNEGRRTELLLWRQGAARVLRPDVRIEDLMLQLPPVLAVS